MARLFVLGNVNADLILGPQDTWPQRGTETLLTHMDLRPGGAAGNAALALGALGVPHTLIGSRGTDVLGDWLEGQFPGAVLGHSAGATSITVGLTHPDGERTFFTHLGHLAEFALEHARTALEQARPGDGLLLLGAFVLPRLRAQYAQLLELARSLGLCVALDPGWPTEGWTPQVQAEVRGWLAHTDHLLINALECLGLSGQGTLEQAAHHLGQLLPGGAVLVVKRGPEGAWCLHNGQLSAFPAPQVTVVDTIGAGDTFDAAYLAALLTGGCPLEEAVREGIETASRAVSTAPRQYAASSAALPR